ncbi:thiamine pyrophosphate-dependent dehydrogenase E1 component subunit alpha [Paenibacillus eucommiae]|uniref:Pyruvate dehydrogenase E1 component alpha subunit n=1 Tax=Paenibacillus eucommiae TaxID=1355755 RepID=A0ABS4J4H6_9BACL|nr:thiamine pyrophosphate-dependent dehydrogenase E1 component subunit alpha [Paenibacillus eucommiae]MBP1994001.1 pyruvate dehydrogenase E1 component alpha subunit [Paenibacillus eucommiae]
MSKEWSKELGMEMYRSMLRIRKFEERVIRLVNENEIAGVTHEYIGQEAVAVGISAALEQDDIITSTHRGHGHIIAKGGLVRRMMAELFGRSTGYNRGRGGSMHIADLSLGIYGANGIVAAGAPIAMGAAWASKVSASARVAVSFFGDGAVNQGVLHETMNMASLWKLPVLFVCENNGYAVTLSSQESSANTDFAGRAAAYRMPGIKVDGMDVLQVLAAARQAIERARAGEGPTFLECMTYRYMGHHTAEATMSLQYRSKEEIEAWKLKDPIPCLFRDLQAQGVAAEEMQQALVEIECEIEEAVEYARQSPDPQPAESLELMYATPYPGLPAKGWI